MEAKLIDFKQPLEINPGKINRNQELKTKDFKNTLNSVMKDTKTSIRNSTKETKVIEKEVVESLEDKVLKKDEKISYESMINLLNIMPVLDEDTEIHMEKLVVNIVESDIAMISDNDELSNETIMDEELMNLINTDEDSKDMEDSAKIKLEELKTGEPIRVDSEETKSELGIKNIDGKGKIVFETNESEKDSTIVEESNVVNMEQSVNGENISGFNTRDQNSEAKSERQYELAKSENNEKDLEINNESFAPFIKDGIEFSSEKPIEVEVPIIEPKQIVKQIVDKVKFDLSEGKNEMKLSLKPAMLGEMTMNIEVSKGEIIAKIMVDNYRTKEIVEGNIIQLKEGIEETGMEIKTFEVFVGNGSDFDKHNSSQFNLKQNSKKIRVKTGNNKVMKDYEDGTMNNNINSPNYYTEGGLNLLA